MDILKIYIGLEAGASIQLRGPQMQKGVRLIGVVGFRCKIQVKYVVLSTKCSIHKNFQMANVCH